MRRKMSMNSHSEECLVKVFCKVSRRTWKNWVLGRQIGLCWIELYNRRL